MAAGISLCVKRAMDESTNLYHICFIYNKIAGSMRKVSDLLIGTGDRKSFVRGEGEGYVVFICDIVCRFCGIDFYTG